MKRKQVLAVSGVATVVVCIALGMILWQPWHGSVSEPLYPYHQRMVVPFAALYPTTANKVTLASDKSFNYFASEQLLVLTVQHQEARTKLVMNEQAIPTDIRSDRSVYEQLVTSMGEYGSFNSAYGKVNLTRPVEQDKKQVACLLTSSVLIFVRADDDLTDEQWRLFFESLTY